MPLRFHPSLPIQNPNSVWTFNGTFPPKLVHGPLRRAAAVPPSQRAAVRRDGRTAASAATRSSTHEHNGHHGAENDGFTGAFFFPGQFYDYHWPIVLAGHYSINTGATDRMASTPDGSGGPIKIPGDWHETMSTHWFHDHMFSFTAQNVYKGNAAMFNIYSGLDRGNEAINDGVNLRLPSGTAKDWGNLDYDVNLMLADKALGPGRAADLRHLQLRRLPRRRDDHEPRLQAVLRGRAPQVPLPHPQRQRLAVLQGRARQRVGHAQLITQIANDGNLLPHPVLADRARRAGHRRALRHRHRLLAVRDRRQAAPREPGRAPTGRARTAEADAICRWPRRSRARR